MRPSDVGTAQDCGPDAESWEQTIRTSLAALLAAATLALAACGTDVTGGTGAAPDVTTEPTPTPTPAVSVPTTTPSAPEITFTWVGDVTMGWKVRNPPGEGDAMFAQVSGLLTGADLTWGNLEGALATGSPTKCPTATPSPDAVDPTGATASPTKPTCYAFGAPPANAHALARAGFDGMNLANNHAHDYGSAGLAGTEAALKGAGLTPSGRRNQIAYVQAKGVTVAVLGFSSYGWSSDITSLATVRRLVSEAASKAAIVVVLFHGGAEGADQIHVPNGVEHAFGENRGDLRAFAHAAIDAGADLVAGSGPHVLRGMEVYAGRLVAYSLGNFAGNDNFNGGGNLSLSGVLTVRMGADGALRGGHFDSLVLGAHDWPAPDPAKRALALVDSVSRQDFGAQAVRLDAAGDFAA